MCLLAYVISLNAHCSLRVGLLGNDNSSHFIAVAAETQRGKGTCPGLPVLTGANVLTHFSCLHVWRCSCYCPPRPVWDSQDRGARTTQSRRQCL